MLSWRDTSNPEGGGAEIYLEKVAAGLVARGDRVTVFTARYPGSRRREVSGGVTYVRYGSKLTVYLWGMLLLALGRLGPLGRADVVVDVQNGLPFFSRLATRRPVLVLVHHVHREQWPVVYQGFMGRLGWWLESRFSPWLYRHCQYVAVSRATRDELAELGVRRAHVAVVHNGSDPTPAVTPVKTEHPSICVVGRLVPHKRIEQAIDTVEQLREEFPTLRLTIVGTGWWEEALKQYAATHAAPDAVEFLGFVDDATKAAVYERSWVMAVPSLKEGWGLVITEAAGWHTPSVAYRSAGGTTESIVAGESGLLVDTPDEFTARIGDIVRDDVLRKELSEGAAWHAAAHTWAQTQHNFAAVVDATARHTLVAASD
jgi:glycosyltransferase involved in cell wall biosynthesis